MKKNCLTCRYEPEWKEDKGHCKFPWPKCDCAAFIVGKGIVYRAKFGKGYTPFIAFKKVECGAWAAKEKK